MKEYITSDPHYMHRNICGSEGFVETRKHFKDAEEMTEEMIVTHNRVVTDADVVYMLGDVGINVKPKDLYEIMCRLKGSFVMVKGNHCSSKFLNYLRKHNYKLPNGRDKFEIHEVGLILKRHKKVYYLTHYPLGLGEMRKNMRNLCGHIHEEVARDANVLNVGVDSPEVVLGQEFGAPILLEDAMRLVEEKWERWYEKVQRLQED